MLTNKNIIGTLLIGSVMSLVAIASVSCLSGCDRKKGSLHEGHNHAEKNQQDSGDGHEGRDHSQSIPVTQEQIKRLDIRISRAALGSVRREIRIPGEIKVNSDRMAHVAPRAPGVVRQVTRILGDSVKSGEALAWIESDKLAEAKLNFYAKESEVGCCDIKLPRAQSIFENVARLTALLRKEAPEKEIKKLDGLQMGKYRGLMMTSYAAYLAARADHKRESGLHAKKISSGRELLAAETALTQARTKFGAIMDTARYETLIAYTEAIQERQVAVFNAVAAEKQLRLKGADDKTITELRALVPKTASLKPCLCDDPNCKDGQLPSIAAALAKDGRFTWYALRAPFDGTVIAKHIVTGESIDEATEVFTIANLSTVWVDLAISQNDIPSVYKGYDVTIRLPDGSKSEGKVKFVSPIVASDTRTAMARVVLPNPDGKLRPGTFVDTAVKIPARKDAIVIPKAAVQLVGDYTCVFVWGDADFELRAVTTGVTDGKQIEILRGLKVGEAVASKNAFHLKAEFTKSGDDFGGHGHPH